MLENVEKTLSVGSLVHIRAPSLSQLPERRIMCLEAGSEWLYPTTGFNPDDENSAVGIFFQVCNVPRQKSIICSCIDSTFFLKILVFKNVHEYVYAQVEWYFFDAG